MKSIFDFKGQCKEINLLKKMKVVLILFFRTVNIKLKDAWGIQN